MRHILAPISKSSVVDVMIDVSEALLDHSKVSPAHWVNQLNAAGIVLLLSFFHLFPADQALSRR